MKEKLIAELKKIKKDLINIDASFNTINENDFEHKKQLETLREIELILTNLRNRVNRFYTEKYQYNKELENISKFLTPFRTWFLETPPGGYSMEECKQRIIGIIDGIIDELEKYNIPSDEDPKFDKK